jgi:lysylphosphatidylglycerol synthase-like protein
VRSTRQKGVPLASTMLGLMRSRAFRFALTLCALGFVGWSGWTLSRRWHESTVTVDVVTASCAFAAMIVSTGLLGVAWSLLIRAVARTPPPFSRLLSVYATSGLGKYVPGKLGTPVMRMSGLAPYGCSARLVATSIVIEVVSWAATGAAVAALLLLLGSAAASIYGPYVYGVGVIAMAATILLASINTSSYPAAIRRLIDHETRGPILPWQVPLVHLASWALWTAHATLLSRAVGVQSLADATHAAAFFVLAPIAGFLALPMPAGVGVRESFMSLGLAPIVGASNALAAALLSRGASLAADLFLWAVLSRTALKNVASTDET